MEILRESLYDHPKYYDLVFGSDWKAEFDFLNDCFERHCSRTVRRLFEPACGTGRLMYRLAQAGFEVTGNDLNPRAVAYCNARLARHGFPPAAVVGDMADFRLRRKVDAALNTINSFRHLPSEAAAESHLRCVAAALARGGIYVLGLHLTPTGPIHCEEESWSARRGHLAVNTNLWSIEIDRRRRRERVGMAVDVYTPRRQFRLLEEMDFRIYTARQFRRLLGSVGAFEVAETYDFAYRIDHPVEVDGTTEDVVFVLRKK